MKLTFFGATLASYVLAQNEELLDNLTECRRVAGFFDNTCDSEDPIDLAGSSGESACGGAWTRKLCVTCTDRAGIVYMNV